MQLKNSTSLTNPFAGFLTKLGRDHSGNTLALVAAAVIPLMAMAGGGIDMGRSYLSESRLQQACDAGVLGARKKLGSKLATVGTPPSDIQAIGDKFFGQNFRSGAYGSTNRSFTMTVEADSAISGVAHVDVPTTIMGMFGYQKMSIDVKCEAKLNFSNTDIMFVLDTTGSMAQTNPSDSSPRIDVLKTVVKSFYSQIETNKTTGTRVRYGFLPYSTNVHVAPILQSDWMVDKWTYQSREPRVASSWAVDYYYVTYTMQSGSLIDVDLGMLASCPADTFTSVDGPTTIVSPSPNEYWYDQTKNGDKYTCTPKDGKYAVTAKRFTDYVLRAWWKFAYTGTYYDWTNDYKPRKFDVSSLKAANGSDAPLYGSIPADIEGSYGSGTAPSYNIANTGCIEERDTYEITDWSNVDLNKALDLNIDLVPSKGNDKTQWRPMLPELVFEREKEWDGNGGAFNTATVTSYDYFLNPNWFDIEGCPAPARKLAEMTSTDVDTYLSTLYPDGDTYHDIGMIWGARMLSPTGLFASENADVSGKPTARHLIFLTDGETDTYEIDYGAYGVEPLDRRRWRSQAESGISLNDVVEKRFGVACAEAKKRNITVWVIGFGTTLNPIMTDCAGPGHYFEASDAAQLTDVFSKIAAQLGDLRISK